MPSSTLLFSLITSFICAQVGAIPDYDFDIDMLESPIVAFDDFNMESEVVLTYAVGKDLSNPKTQLYEAKDCLTPIPEDVINVTQMSLSSSADPQVQNTLTVVLDIKQDTVSEYESVWSYKPSSTLAEVDFCIRVDMAYDQEGNNIVSAMPTHMPTHMPTSTPTNTPVNTPTATKKKSKGKKDTKGKKKAKASTGSKGGKGGKGRKGSDSNRNKCKERRIAESYYVAFKETKISISINMMNNFTTSPIVVTRSGGSNEEHCYKVKTEYGITACQCHEDMTCIDVPEPISLGSAVRTCVFTNSTDVIIDEIKYLYLAQDGISLTTIDDGEANDLTKVEYGADEQSVMITMEAVYSFFFGNDRAEVSIFGTVGLSFKQRKLYGDKHLPTNRNLMESDGVFHTTILLESADSLNIAQSRIQSSADFSMRIFLSLVSCAVVVVAGIIY